MALGDELADLFYVVAPTGAARAHQQQVVGAVNVALAKPVDATHIKIQSHGANLRYTLDNQPASPTFGFRLLNTYGTVEAVHMANINVCSEAGNTTIDYMWLSRYRAGGG